jgi:DNA-binding PadR family transcriptional regulator
MGHRYDHGGPWGEWPGRWGGRFGAPRGRGRRAQRGDVRTAILAVLEEEPRHGYEVITELERRSGGRWRPSPGSVYPTLQMLEDEGLVTGEERDGRRVFALTDDGRRELAERRDRTGWTPPWEGRDEVGPLREAAFSVMAAAMQAGGSGNEHQQQMALDALTEARKKIYAALAED